jgi:hypothetical protein
MPAWETHDPTLARPIAAPLEHCAELLGVDLDTLQKAATHVDPYLRVDGTKVWSLMQLERLLPIDGRIGSSRSTPCFLRPKASSKPSPSCCNDRNP